MVVLEHCAWGSLEDLPWNEALPLGWTFKASLLLVLLHVSTLPRPGAVGDGEGGEMRDASIPQT